jgi:predicted N-acyltransferase
VTNRLYRIAPSLLSLRLLAIGSPVAEICHLGFAPEVADDRKPWLLQLLVKKLQCFGSEQRYGLFGVKDAPSHETRLWETVLAPAGLTRLPGLPTAMLDLPYASIDDYLATLSRATRKDMRRKMKAFRTVRVEQRRAIDDVAHEVAALYEETVAHSDLKFEHLPPDYFGELLRQLTPDASIFLYWAGENLIAFNFVIEAEDRLIDKYIGINYSLVENYHPYFNSWLCNVRYCIARGIPTYQSGQAFYGPKLRLGCRLQANWQYFRHEHAGMNALLRLVAKFVRLDRFDPAIANLMKAK